MISLEDKIENLKGVGKVKKEAFNKAGIYTVADLLHLKPAAYEDRSRERKIGSLKEGDKALITGYISGIHKSGFGKKATVSCFLSDKTGRIRLYFFNSPFMEGFLKSAHDVSVYGQVGSNKGILTMANPRICHKGSKDDIRGIIPIYPKIEGLSSSYIYKLIQSLTDLLRGIPEWIPYDIASRERIAPPGLTYRFLHMPLDGKTLKTALYRISFEELLIFEMGLLFMKESRRVVTNEPLDCSRAWMFIDSLGFSLTEDQKKVWQDIEKDISSTKVMNRLLQGDVGSGKTAISMIGMFCTAISGKQGAVMAPTEILAKQHFENFTRALAPFNIKVGLLIGSQKNSERREVLAGIENGEIQVVIGTHALISKGVRYKDLAFVVTDEQHRFGVNQRGLLSEKGECPNILVMTATPIPRTLSVILFGDLDISFIRTKPLGRKEVITQVFDNMTRIIAYENVREELKKGHQAFVVAPLIDESESLDLRSATMLYEELQGRFKEFSLGLLHGNMKEAEKDAIMEEFKAGKYHILVSTVVIEVGIDISNATCMVIEEAQRFGLAQLHQLRGRVGRGSAQSYCFLIGDAKSEEGRQRLKIMEETNDGFKISEEDLKLRGPGEIFGTRQSGLGSLISWEMASDVEMLELARDVAMEILDKDPLLESKETQPLRKAMEKKFGENLQLRL